jgi:hypothetical protein
MDVQATGEVFIPQKKTSSTSKFELSSLLWVIWPFWIRIRIRITNADPDPADQNECGSGSATIVFWWTTLFVIVYGMHAVGSYGASIN